MYRSKASTSILLQALLTVYKFYYDAWEPFKNYITGFTNRPQLYYNALDPLYNPITSFTNKSTILPTTL